MTILQKPLQSGDGHAGQRWYKFGHADQSVRYTEAWEHENFAEEQARWERNDPAYARMCEQVRQAKDRGGEASRRADEAKADWDAHVATRRQADDAAQRAHHALQAGQTIRRRSAMSRISSQRWTSRSLESTQMPPLMISAREGPHHMHTTFAIESNDSPAAAIIPEPVRVHDEPARIAPRGERRAARLSFRGRATGNAVRDEPMKLEVQQWLLPKQPS
jgi:hypothetical protein